ncbi:MAG TPA: hypothetical protein VJ302_01175 [Blastocatellia bacterium]|nr:hypothetical protein [Blastocatellia bacterium]
MSISKTIRFVGALLLLMGIGQASFAQGVNRWVFLGQTQVNGQRDHDRINIGRAEGRFNSIQIRVQGAPVEFQRVVVNYANGTNEEIELRDRIPAGSQTRAIDLRGGDRTLSSVDFWYSKTNWRSARPRVSLYGVDIGRRPTRPGPWVFLGQTQVNGRDRDRITVGRAEGRFNSIQLRVQGSPVEFQRVIVNYANGTNEEIDFRDRIAAGGQTRAIDLRGENRVISSIDFLYTSGNWRPRFQPKVSVYGR